MLRMSLMLAGVLAANSALAIDTTVFTQTDVAYTKIEGRGLRTAGLRTGALVDILPHLRAGLSVGGTASTEKTGLFDDFLGYDISAELGSSLTFGSWQPFFSLRVPLHSDFGATGSFNDYPTNVTSNSTAAKFEVIKPNGEHGGYYGRSGQLTRDYKLKGTINGGDLSLGTGYTITENFALTVSAGYSARTLRIREAELEGSPWPEVRWAFSERHGLETSETENGSAVKPTRKSRFFGGASFALGMTYKI